MSQLRYDEREAKQEIPTMLTQPQLTQWFRSNGIDIGIPFPMALMRRLFRKALETDDTLFLLLGKCFEPHKGLLMLAADNWEKVFLCYSLCCPTYGLSKVS